MAGRNIGRKEEFQICSAEYGKNGVRLLHVTRSGGLETPREFEVTTRIKLNSRKEYTEADNRDVLSTDSQKNIVYVLAKKYGISTPEEFAILVAQYLLDRFPHIVESCVTVAEMPWDRIQVGGVPHNHAFLHSPVAERWTSVTINRKDPPILKAGLRGLRVLKTTKSAFKNFFQEEFRTLPDTEDRLFSTIVGAEWVYSSHIGVDFDRAWNKVLECILDKFAGPPDEGLLSYSVQNTLYLSCTMALESIPQISRIQMDMPNKHYLTVDLSPFPKDLIGYGENKSVYLPLDKPSGFIHAAVERRTASKL